MLQRTEGIVLRSVKYGETSLVSTIFTRFFGTQSYLVQGVRTSKMRQNKAALFQPASLLELVAYQHPQKNLQRLREFQTAYIYQSLQEEVIKNSVALFSVELLLRLLPENAPQEDLFDFCFDYFKVLDQLPVDTVANFPLYFVMELSRTLGYELNGDYSEATPHLNLYEGGYSGHPPQMRPFVADEDAKMLSELMHQRELNDLKNVKMNGVMRFRLLDWYIEFLQQHSQHLGTIKSLPVLREILH
ncbi:MAG TPA: DNA repair protein RecO [Flavipsychrobacter sp.]|nr:DNA repair protein RecO [Flavipsychrobacter sp.]